MNLIAQSGTDEYYCIVGVCKESSGFFKVQCRHVSFTAGKGKVTAQSEPDFFRDEAQARHRARKAFRMKCDRKDMHELNRLDHSETCQRLAPFLYDSEQISQEEALALLKQKLSERLVTLHDVTGMPATFQVGLEYFGELLPSGMLLLRNEHGDTYECSMARVERAMPGEAAQVLAKMGIRAKPSG